GHITAIPEADHGDREDQARERRLVVGVLSPQLGLVRHCYEGWRRRKATVDQHDVLAERFESHRACLRAIAY
ncbi:MAG TPA: hypothetical protein VGP04_07625, partial [Pseudonocardiaceae bacterium]|nr:hypothetical protein [Pseudonocardiaceae bacterium]